MILPSAPACDLENDRGYCRLKQHIVEVTGLAYYLDKDVELTAHVNRRLTNLGMADCGGYLDLLLDGPAGEMELDSLATELTIGETFFFRHQELFDALKSRVFPELIARNRQHRRLRIWSAGCATGAEPYSLAILLRREFPVELAGWDVSIVGTDINREFLAQAQRGEFGEWAFRSACNDLQASCFARLRHAWVINEEFRRGLSFQYHNLVQHPFPSLINGLSAFDLILCRNVMIYFSPPTVLRLVGQFHDALVEGGWFVVGPAEPCVGLFRAFRTVNVPGAVLYRKAFCPNASEGFAPQVATIASPLPLPAFAVGQCHRPAVARTDPSHQATADCQPALADARTKLNRGQFEAAAKCCQHAIATDGLNPLVHFYYALAAEGQGWHSETETALRRAIYLDRHFVLAHYYLGLILRRNRDIRAAHRSFRNVLALLDQRDEVETFSDADGLTVGALRQLTQMYLEVLQRT